jgi:anti-sigma factor ChrR (cupin superfamily)
MLNCREMSELGSDIIDGHLRLGTRLQVMMHLRMCPRCRMYIRQLKLTSGVLQRMPLSDGAVDAQGIVRKLKDSAQ